MNPDGSEIFRIHPDKSWDPLGLLYIGYWVSLFMFVKFTDMKMPELTFYFYDETSAYLLLYAGTEDYLLLL
jgi:hypothetical protein